MLVKQEIRDLTGGMSTAPAWQAPPNTVAGMYNMMAVPERGVIRRRPPAERLRDTLGYDPEKPIHRYHFRVDNREFTMWVGTDKDTGTGKIEVLDAVTGSPLTVSPEANALDYLADAPRVRATTVGNRTYVVNTGVTVAKDSSLVDPSTIQGALIWIPSVQAGHYYHVVIGGTEEYLYVATSGDSPAKVVMELKDLVNADSASHLHVAEAHGEVLHLYNTVFGYPTSPAAGSGAYGVGVLYTLGEVRDPTQLPPLAPDGYRIHITGDDKSEFDDYYVIFDEGEWVETYRHAGGFDKDTMPHLLEWNGSLFTFGPVAWAERTVGDENTNPLPSIVGRTIDDVFVIEGRLGFISGTTIVLSRSNQPENFFRPTTRVLADDDPVDVDVQIPGVTTFQSVFSWNERTYITSDTGQYILAGDPIITPRSIQAVPLTNYEVEGDVKPAVSGGRVFFAREADGNAQVLVWTHPEEYPATAFDLTRSVPGFVRGKPLAVAVDDALGFLALATDQEEEGVSFYVCRYSGLGGANPFVSWAHWHLYDDTLGEQPVVDHLQMLQGNLIVHHRSGEAAMLDRLPIAEAISGLDASGYDFGTTPYEGIVLPHTIFYRDEFGQAQTYGKLHLNTLEILATPQSIVEVGVVYNHRTTVWKLFNPGEEARVPIRDDNEDVNILVISPADAAFTEITGFVWEGRYTDRTRRRR